MARYDGSLQVPQGGAMGAPERRLLATMQLHAITAVQGEAGLRERLLIEAGRFVPADWARVVSALDLMSRLHAGDRRQREPYVCHPLRVAVRVLSHYRVSDADVACAALLHDTVEDHAPETTAGGRDAALLVLGGEFGGRVAGLVGAVTNPVYAPGRDEHEQYREYVAESLEGSPWARVIKVSDFADNAVGLSTRPGRGCPGWRPSTGPWSRCCATWCSARTRRSTRT